MNDPVRTRPARAETRRRVLDAAFAVFGERGIAGSSLTEVARAAGLTKGAVYSNFRSKDDLVLALMEEHAMHRLSRALGGITATTDVDEALATAAAVLVRAMHDGAAWHRLLAEYFALSHRDPDRREGLRLRRREARDAVARALTRVAATTEIRLPLPAPDLAAVLFALSNGLAMESAIDPDAVPDALLGEVLALLFGRRDAAQRQSQGERTQQ
jgi:AcrR family transcriptional regulator